MIEAILRDFAPDDHVLTLAELVRMRLLDRVDTGYQLSGGLFELGMRGMRASVERSLLEMAMPFLQDLYERTQRDRAPRRARRARGGLRGDHRGAAVGITCVAAPVLGVDDRPIAAVSVTGPVTRPHAREAINR